MNHLECLFLLDAAAIIINGFAEGGLHVQLHQAVVLDVSGNRPNFATLGIFVTHRRIPVRTILDNLGNRGPGFCIVQNRWFAPQPLVARMWRLRFHQCRRLSIDKRFQPFMYPEVDAEICT